MGDTPLCKNCAKYPALQIDLCQDCYENSVILTREDGSVYSWYTPQMYQRPYHESNAPNLLALGTRKTGKSTQARKDAIIRCMKFPGYKVLILRRTIPDLRKSHLRYINREMAQLGKGVGYYRETTFDVLFANGSFIQFSHCETLKDVENYLGSEWDLIIFDEVSTFTLDMFLQISAAANSPVGMPYKALVRACSNTLGIGAEWMQQWFINKNVNLEDYPDYDPNDFEMQFSTLENNIYISQEEYVRRLKNLPDHIRRSWLLGEFVFEGAYFSDFKRTKDSKPWHVISDLPMWKGRPIFEHTWMGVYRAVDWGYHPDPAVCLWIVVIPNKVSIVFKERTWKRTLAADVAQQIKRESEGMHVIETFCDPTMSLKTGTTYSISELFEQNGVPLTDGKNDRALYGYSIHNYLNTIIDEQPQLQIVQPMGMYGCPELIRTLPILRMDDKDPSKIADGEDHWAVALAQFCMGMAMPAQDPQVSNIPRWMRPKTRRQYAV